MSPIASISSRLDAIESKLNIPSTSTAGRPGGVLGGADPSAAANFSTLLDQAGGFDRTGASSVPLGAFSAASGTSGGIDIASLLGGGALGLPTNSSAAGSAAVAAGMNHLGVPYLWGGTDPVNGFDCSGLVQDAFRQIGVEMPKWSRHQAQMGVEVPTIDQAVPGDVLAFGEPVNHVALYVGNGRMLHAPRTGDVVKVQEIDRPIATIRRIVSPGAGLTTPGGLAAGSGPSNANEAQYTGMFQSAGAAHGIDSALLAAVASVESGFDPNAVSGAGAQGLMQFMPATASDMGVNAFDPASAVDGAARYLRENLDRFGSVELALAAYNAGPGAVSRHNGIPPYQETQNYVRKVMAAWQARS